ncbi:NAD-dependent epimerase/dehydratase family protein [Litorisediminicola beolgyonensis]|uniref:NAD-dependent epimerase/dehydratase family protein n=1 Tax=Litorisediminicola beolgyonensis TaxID=1173614 RepID=A0ABW3ZDX5_9RHOB
MSGYETAARRKARTDETTEDDEMAYAERKILLPGGAGLVGQNLVVRLKAAGFTDLVVIDKHAANLRICEKLHPDITCIEADLARRGDWARAFEGADSVVMLQAQIGGLRKEAFDDNNVRATELVLDAMRRFEVTGLVHISSSVVNSAADDFYTRSKTTQEEIVRQSEFAATILRPTLMFGWFDRKHLGWLSRFMGRVPVFPVPGDGRYMRQPLYVGDFCDIILSCLKSRGPEGTFDISGQEKIDYIDLIHEVRRAARHRTPIVKIPFGLFRKLLQVWALFDRDPPFTPAQLDALVTRDEFRVIDWPEIFGVRATPLAEAMDATFRDPTYSDVVLEF